MGVRKPVYVFISDRNVLRVSGTNKFISVNFDNLEHGNCPICTGNVYTDDGRLVCRRCGIDWDEQPDYDEIIAMHQAHEQLIKPVKEN